jgi:adenylosuccinate synthase
MPKNAKKYLERLEEIAGAKISMISTGAERGQIIKI